MCGFSARTAARAADARGAVRGGRRAARPAHPPGAVGAVELADDPAAVRQTASWSAAPTSSPRCSRAASWPSCSASSSPTDADAPAPRRSPRRCRSRTGWADAGPGAALSRALLEDPPDGAVGPHARLADDDVERARPSIRTAGCGTGAQCGRRSARRCRPSATCARSARAPRPSTARPQLPPPPNSSSSSDSASPPSPTSVLAGVPSDAQRPRARPDPARDPQREAQRAQRPAQQPHAQRDGGRAARAARRGRDARRADRREPQAALDRRARRRCA